MVNSFRRNRCYRINHQGGAPWGPGAARTLNWGAAGEPSVGREDGAGRGSVREGTMAMAMHGERVVEFVMKKM